MSTEGRIAAGFYPGRAIAGSEQYAVNPENGNEQIAIDLDIPSIGRQFTTFLYFTDRAAPYAIERLRACGWKGDDLSKLVGIDENEITVQIAYEMYKGEEKLKVQIATGGGRVKLENQMDEKAKRAFATRMKSLVKGTGGGNGNGGQKPPQGQRRQATSPPADDFGGGGAGAGDDGIPF